MNTKYISKIAAAALVTVVGCAGESSKGPEGAEAAGRQWIVGDSFVYDVTSARDVSNGQFHSKLTGVLAITVVGEEPGGEIELRGDVRKPSYTQTPAQDLSEELAKPFFFKVLPTGEIKGFLFSEGVSSGAAAVQRELALSLQIVDANDPDAPRAEWHAVERDSTGKYDATYTMAGSAIHKSKGKYLERNGAKGGSPIAGIDGLALKSSADFTLDRNHWPATVAEEESATATAGQLVITSTKSSSARLVTVEKRPALVGSMESASLVPDTAIDAQARALARIQADQNLVDGKSFEQIAEALGSEDTMTRNHAQARLAALIRLDAKAAASARAEVLAGKGDINTKKRLIGALGTAGTKEAQGELVALLGDANIGVARTVDVLVAIGLTKAPTAESAAAVGRAMESEDKAISSTAVLASGSVIRAMVASGAGDTAGAMNGLTTRLAKAADDNEKVLYLEALGNTGDARAFAAIQPYLAAESVQVRAAAVHGMRFMDGDAADKVVIAGMNDPELDVQRAAASTLAFRPVAPVLAAARALLDSEVDQTVKKAVKAGLAAKKQELAWLSDNANGDVQKIAIEMLQAK